MTDSQKTVKTLAGTGSGTELTSRKDNICSHPGKGIVVASGSCKINLCLLCCVEKYQIFNVDGKIPISLKQLRKKLTVQHELSEQDVDSQHLESHDTATVLQEPSVVTRGRAHLNRAVTLAKKHWSTVHDYIRQKELSLPLLSLFVVVISALLLVQLTDIDECSPNPCKHGGSCADTLGTFSCACEKGFCGETCEFEINECSSNPCQNGGTCLDGVGSFTCSCPGGVTGETCDVETDECSSNPCQYGGTCTDGLAFFSCTCPEGLTGDICTEDIDECSSHPCQNGGTCTDRLASFTCSCLEGFTGKTCNIDIDECSSNPCQFGGTCKESLASFTCSCPQGFTGETCNIAPQTGPGSERFFVKGARVIKGPNWVNGVDHDGHGPGIVTEVEEDGDGLWVWVSWDKRNAGHNIYIVGAVQGYYELKLLHVPDPW